MAADLRFWFDPVCPFAWMTSRWVRMVAEQRSYEIEWRFISLRLINKDVDYGAQFPPDYEAGHTGGLRLLRVAAAARDAQGNDGVGRFYDAVSSRIFDEVPPPVDADGDPRARPDFVRPALEEAGLPSSLLAALDDTSRDPQIQAETDEAFALTGRDVGTPIIQFRPPEGVAFFGPVISRRPSPDDAVTLWDHVIGLAEFGGFAELKRSLRERPQLRSLGWEPSSEAGAVEDWHGGSRRRHR